jgi:glycerol-3-phosphate dehydrogenase
MNRENRIALLAQQAPFDLLVIGGGATGCGIAVDAASRGLKVALIEKNDLAEGTSSRSTKMVHGGVRYLEMAVKKFDWAQYHLVREALHERAIFLKVAPHLAERLPLVTPLYSWLEVPYVFAGLLLYDLLAGRKGLGHSTIISRKEALRRFPMLKSEGLKAGVVYYDGQFNDARMAVALALTAEKHGALVATHLEALGLEKHGGKTCGARVRDTISGEAFTIKARGVANAAGPFVDRIRQMDEPSAPPILEAAAGIHIVLSGCFVPPQTGMLIPKTEDGRVLFVLPWQGHALIGTTDSPSEIVDHPQAKEGEIAYLLRHINKYFDMSVSRADVTAVWCGLRPLIRTDGAANTAQLVREHLLEMSPSGLLSIAGGKWTSYRKMAQEAVDQAIDAYGLKPARGCQTERAPLVGAENLDRQGEKILIRRYGLDLDIVHHLHCAYGDQARKVGDLTKTGLGSRLHSDHPYIEAEVVYAARHEFAERASDVLTRRIPLALLNTAAARLVLPRVIALMAGELGWNPERCGQELEIGMQRLNGAI